MMARFLATFHITGVAPTLQRGVLSKEVLSIVGDGAKKNSQFFDLANSPDTNEGAVDNFAKEILYAVGICNQHRNREIAVPKKLALFVCGELCYAKPEGSQPHIP
jgi:hypothetical protein